MTIARADRRRYRVRRLTAAVIVNQLIAGRFARAEPRTRVREYVSGLVAGRAVLAACDRDYGTGLVEGFRAER